VIETFDFLLTAIVLASQSYITAHLWKRAGRNTALRSAIVAFDVVVLFGYVCSFSYVTAALGISSDFTAFLGAAALGYLIIATCVLVLYAILHRLGRRFADPPSPSRRRALNAISGAVMAAPAAAIGYGTFIERDRIHQREIDLPIPNLPADLDGLRILQLSDIHLSAFLSESTLARAISAAVETKPDLAVVTGDLISTRFDPVDACIRQLARVKAPAGVYGCMGNHERYAHAESYVEQAAARAGIEFLRDAHRPLRFGQATLNLAGVDHQSKRLGRKYLVGAERMVDPNAFNLLLTHNPDVLPVAAGQGYDLLLSGHTHGGQINIEILDESINPARFVTPFIHGLYRSGRATLFVTRGIGTIGLPTRIGAPPEIPLLRLRKV
jgi:predicted MPP superfamily phosphohydrolase